MYGVPSHDVHLVLHLFFYVLCFLSLLLGPFGARRCFLGARGRGGRGRRTTYPTYIPAVESRTQLQGMLLRRWWGAGGWDPVVLGILCI